jgi:hypothetical protein
MDARLLNVPQGLLDFVCGVKSQTPLLKHVTEMISKCTQSQTSSRSTKQLYYRRWSSQ